ncbi:MAG: YdcF family protein [Fimbriimonas sp.]|nr:YdcF family protein [Fimbriimonas sp.]
MSDFDAVLVPGGGVKDDGEVQPWVKNRLEVAMRISCDFIVTLSAGTTYRPPPIGADEFPIFESVAAARYMVDRGVEPERVLTETCSYDTIGNAYFARTIHTDIRPLHRLMVVTSEFHMPRTRAIFDWIFALPPLAWDYELTYQAVPDVGMDEEALAARIAKEGESLKSLEVRIAQIRDLPALHQWLFSEHKAYKALGKHEKVSTDAAVLRTY